MPEGLVGPCEEWVVTIVADDDVLGLYHVSTRTPLGRALLGHRVGDVVSVRTDASAVAFEVMAVGVRPSTTEARAGDARADRPVQVGDVVDVLDGEVREWWRVVPHIEADAARRCISEQSPLGRALLGHRAGEVVSVHPPAVRGLRIGAWPVTILAVTPSSSRG